MASDDAGRELARAKLWHRLREHLPKTWRNLEEERAFARECFYRSWQSPADRAAYDLAIEEVERKAQIAARAIPDQTPTAQTTVGTESPAGTEVVSEGSPRSKEPAYKVMLRTKLDLIKQGKMPRGMSEGEEFRLVMRHLPERDGKRGFTIDTYEKRVADWWPSDSDF